MSGSSEQQIQPPRLGEVIQTNSLGFWAESEQLHLLPVFGELVRVEISEHERVYGVVVYGETGGIDPSRRAVRRGDSFTSDDALYNRHPELELVLRSIFRVSGVGTRTRDTVQHHLPALPVPLHFTVRGCGPFEVENFCANPRYLPMLLSNQGEVPPEAVVAAHLRWVDSVLQDDHRWLTDASRRLARLMKRDYDLLVNVLEAIDPGS